MRLPHPAPLLGRPAVLLALAAAACAAEARAGGGAHVVDDDAVLDPGVCHAENWITLADRGGGALVTIAPACTLADLPEVEWALAVQHQWGGGAGDATSMTPAVKVNLRPAARGVGIAASAAVTLDPASGEVTAAALNLPVSVPVTQRLVLHGNLGWLVAPQAADGHALFWGAQAEFFLRPQLVVMGELFGQDRGPAGAQWGLRWVTGRGRIDVDLLAGHRIDGSRADFLTLGVTIRR